MLWRRSMTAEIIRRLQSAATTSAEQIAVTLVRQFEAAIKNLRRRLELERFIDKLPALRNRQTLHGAFDSRHECRARAQFIHPETEQKRNERDIAGHLTAHTDPNVIRVGGVGDHLEQAEHGWMRRLVEMRDALVHAIDRERVLNQIVRADAEKIDFARENVGGDCRTGDLDHRARFSCIAECRSGATQFFLAFVQDRHRLPQFVQAGNHREHDFHIADRTGPKDCTQLSFKDVGVFETKTNGPPAEKRIEFVTYIDGASGQLVASEIERADDQRIWRNALRNFSIRLLLFLLSGKRVAIQIKKFRAIKADSLGAIGCNRIDIVRKFDISREDDVTSVAGGRLCLAKLF